MRLRLAAAGLLSALMFHLALPGGGSPWLGWGVLLLPLIAFDRLNAPARAIGRWMALPMGLLFGILEFRWMRALVPASDVTIPWIMIPATFVWILYVTLYFWLFFRGMAALRDRLGHAALWAAPPLWVLLEWIRSSGVFAFSWVNLSQTQAALGGTLAPAGWIGGLGMSFLMVFIQVAAVRGADIRGRDGRLARGLLFASLLLLVTLHIPSSQAGSRSLRVAAAQGNISLEDKWDRSYRDENLRIFRELSMQAADEGAELVVWPETAVPVNILYNRGIEEKLRAIARETGLSILTGFQALAPTDAGYNYSNAMGLFSPNGALEGVYRKVHLLPFGEYVPFAKWLVPGVDIDLGQANFEPGQGERVFEGDRFKVAGFICYEMGFAGDASRAARQGANLLANPTNDGWFEHDIALELHAALAPMRAAETGLPLIRCGNAGVTEIIDGRGRVLDRLPMYTRGLLTADILLPVRPSFYARTGHWLPLVLGVVYSVLWLSLSLLFPPSATSGASNLAQRRS
jgi:apolipoprotein N-acyltransferase